MDKQWLEEVTEGIHLDIVFFWRFFRQPLILLLSIFVLLCLVLLYHPTTFEMTEDIYVIVDEDTILCTNSQQLLIPHLTTDKGFITT